MGDMSLTNLAQGNFLTWHRYYTWIYEQALRDECGYKGYQPYINWGKYAKDLYNAPLFDGSDTSMSNNGAYDKRANGTWIPSPDNPVLRIPRGRGGGCVTEGPFKNMTVNLGPAGGVLPYVTPNPDPSGLGYNPRCLRRDSSAWASKHASTDDKSVDLITKNKRIANFQLVMQGRFNIGLPELGVHTAGHFWVGGDPGGDFFASPGSVVLSIMDDHRLLLLTMRVKLTWTI